MRRFCQVWIPQVLRATALAALLTGCASQNSRLNAPLAASAERMLLPTTGSGAPFLLRTEVNGAGPYWFVLDTGSTRTVVSPRLLDELALSPAPSSATVLDAEGQPVPTGGEVRLDRLVIGPVEARSVPALLMDLSRFEQALAQRVDGIAPASLFAHFTLVIDYPAAQAWCTARPAPRGVPLRHGRLPVIRAQVAGKDIDVLLDSGSGGSWMLPTADLPLVQVGYADRQVEQALGSAQRTRAQLDGDIRVGQAVFHQPIVEHTTGIARVGWHALRGYRVSIDRPNATLALERVGPVADEPVWGIGARFEPLGNVWEIRAIEPGLPADAAGLTDGERILAINGNRADQLDPAALAALIQQAQRLRLDVMRAKGIEQVWVPIVYIQP